MGEPTPLTASWMRGVGNPARAQARKALHARHAELSGGAVRGQALPLRNVQR